jgi:FAD/FMN-containing dehydrogenase
MSIQSVINALPHLAWTTDPALVRQKSRDFFWYSPVLKRQLNRVTGEAVVTPRDEAELRAVLAAAYAHDVPVTPRGAGTGNYGQAMPLRGGIVLEMTEFNRILWAKPGVVRAGAGCKLIDLDAQLRRDVGGELRFHPSTRRTATLGGFIAGGSSGIGSTTYGILREPGNILGLKVVTMESGPRVLELRGTDIDKANHAYGTNGIITEVEMPLAPAWDWVDVVVSFPTLMGAARFADSFCRMDGVVKKLACVVPAPIPQDHFRSWGGRVPAGHSVALLMIAPPFLDILPALVAAHGGAEVLREASDAAEVPLYEHSWNHTTLQVLKTDKTITYLQTLYPAPNHLDLIAKLERMFPDEVLRRHRLRLRPPDRPLRGRGAPERDHPPARGSRCADLQPARLHAGGRRHEAGGRDAAGLQAGSRSEGPAEPGQDGGVGRSGLEAGQDGTGASV